MLPRGELNRELRSIQLLPKAHLRHLMAERGGLIRSHLPFLPILYTVSHILNWINTKQHLSSTGTQLFYRNSFTHLRFIPLAFVETEYEKRSFKQSLRAFCKRTVKSTVHYVIQCPLNKKKHMIKFSAKKKFVSLKGLVFLHQRGTG